MLNTQLSLATRRICVLFPSPCGTSSLLVLPFLQFEDPEQQTLHEALGSSPESSLPLSWEPPSFLGDAGLDRLLAKYPAATRSTARDASGAIIGPNITASLSTSLRHAKPTHLPDISTQTAGKTSRRSRHIKLSSGKTLQ